MPSSVTFGAPCQSACIQLDLQREFQRLEKELRTKVQAQRAELMAESARLRFVVTARAKEQRVLARQEAQRLRKDAEAEVKPIIRIFPSLTVLVCT